MLKSLIAATVLAMAPLAQAANELVDWDLNGSSVLFNQGDTIRLTSGAGQTGTAWAPGPFDLSGFTTTDTLVIDFDFRATSGGDALALVLTSGGPMAQAPTDFLGLDGVDDGVMLVLKPGAHAAGSVIFPYAPFGGMPSTLAGRVASFSDPDDDNSALLVDPNSNDEPMHARAEVLYALNPNNVGGSWVFSLSVAQPGSSVYELLTVAKFSNSTNSLPFTDLSRFQFGFVGGSQASAATFDVLNVSTNLPVAPLGNVPEPGTIGLALAGLLVAGWALRRA